MSEFDNVYSEPDADDIILIRLTRRQWHHIDDWRGGFPDRYPQRAAVREEIERAIDQPNEDLANEIILALEPVTGCCNGMCKRSERAERILNELRQEDAS